MPKTDQDRARIRAWHRDRAIVRKIAAEGSALATDRMSEHELWAALSRLTFDLWVHTSDGRDVVSARLARDIQAVSDEIFTRGHQLILPGL